MHVKKWCCAGQWQKTGPEPCPQANVETLALSHGCRSPLGYVHSNESWQLLSGWQYAGAQLEGVTSSRLIEVGASHKGLGWCLVLPQIQMPGLAASLGTSECRVRVVKQGGTQVADIREHKYLWGKSQCNLQGVCAGYPGHLFLRWQKLLGLSAEQVTGNRDFSHCMTATGSPWFSSLFLAVSMCFNFASLWVGWNQNGNCSTLKGWRSWYLCHSSFSSEGNSFYI